MQMKNLATRVRSGDYHQTLPVLSTDEVGHLGDALNNMSRGLLERERMRETFGRAVDPSVRDHLLSGAGALGGTTLEASVLFVDIRGFTTISEHRAPADIVAWLNDYFETVQQAVEAEGGFINKFVGDAALAVFGAPVPTADHALRALGSARRILFAAKNIAPRPGFPPVHLGIGLATGNVLAGNIGSSRRLEYSVIGDAVNLASRVQNLCKETGQNLLFTEELKSRAASLNPNATRDAKAVGEYPIRGRSTPARLWALTGF